MGLSRDQVEKLIDPVEKLLEGAVEKKDATLYAAGYTEDAVFIHLGQSVVRGRKAISEAITPFFGIDVKTFHTEKTAGYDVNNGEYLMRKGRYRIADGPWFKFMQLFEKQPDGSYLVSHDEFEYS